MARDHILVPTTPGPWDIDEVYFHAHGYDMVAEKGWSETTLMEIEVTGNLRMSPLPLMGPWG